MNITESSKRYRLNDDNLENMVSLVDFLYDESKKKSKKRTMYKIIEVPVKTIDGVEYDLPVYVDPNLDGYAALGYDKQDFISTENIALIVNLNRVGSKKNLYNSIYHEFLHAVDPTITSKPSLKYQAKYGEPSERPDLYYSHGIELRAITGEFFEAMVNEFKDRVERLRDKKNKTTLLDSLNNIVSFFVELKPLSPLSYNILDEMNGENDLENTFKKTLSNIFKDYPQTADYLNDTPDEAPYFLTVIDMIRHFSPKGWKRFLTMLYSTREEIKNFLT